MFKPRFAVLTGMILFAALARLIPHPWNFTPVAAIALFGGARFLKKSHAFLVPMTALLLSDLIIGVYGRMPIVYASFALIVAIGLFLRKKRGPWAIAAGVLGGAISFYVITNFGVWAFGSLYPNTWEGLLACYTAALPYFRQALLGDAFYAALLFGSFEFAEHRFAILKKTPVAVGVHP